TEKKVTVSESKKYPVKKAVAVTVKDSDLCPKYVARAVRGVKVRPSPQWLQSRLLVSGLKPISNVVDVTNYVMLELGQPLHAFDVTRLQGRKIVVRRAGKDTSFTTLDGEQRKLSPDMLVIADAKDAVAIAGVMGGQNSEISKTTKEVIIESAIFKPISIRKTRQQLGLVTDASVRFERGIWWGSPEQACDRAAALLAQVSGGEVASGTVVVSKKKTEKQRTVTVSINYISELLGQPFTAAQVKTILERLSIKILKSAKDDMTVAIPPWRADLAIPADIVEEVGRMYGWAKLKPQPMYAALSPSPLPADKLLVRLVQDALVGGGFTETISYSVYGQQLVDQFGLRAADHYRVLNPLNPEQAFLRTTLLPRLHEVILKNSPSRNEMKIFEVGRIFLKQPKGLPRERVAVSLLVYRRQGLALASVKAAVSHLMSSLGIRSRQWRFTPSTVTGCIANITVGTDAVGEVGEIAVAQAKLGSAPVHATLWLDALLAYATQRTKFAPLSEFPAVERDMTFWVSPALDFNEVVSAIRGVDQLVATVRGESLYREQGSSVSMTLRITYAAADRTLTTAEVDGMERRITTQLADRFSIALKK
ncbi:MAG: phenylalanine--tRNA ligase subunit beta, partial [Patescibacteria group bacterium]